MRIRSKLLVLIAVPLLALALAAGFGFSSQSVRIEKAEDAEAAVVESQSAFTAILAIGDERLFRLGAEVATEDELIEATDAALTDLEAAAATAATTETVQAVRAMVVESRGLERMGSQSLLGSAANELLHLDFAGSDAYPTADSRNAAVVNHHAVESLQLREWAWIAYLTTDEVNPASIAELSADFATAAFAINQTAMIDTQGGSNRVQDVLSGAAASRLLELEITAIDDLSEGQLTVATPEILSALADFRAEWGATVRGQTSSLRGAVADELLDANNLRSLFTLLAAVGVVVLTGLIFVVYRSITNPLESLLDRAGSVANEELPNLVDALRHDDGSADLPVAEIIPTSSDDEIGELVAAFNHVQITAYDLATEQALSRRNVADMFVNLGRRNQQLLQRILAQLTQLEQDEEDPEKLRELFELDNVVTRMRRNAESLLALAGAQTARQWSQPIAIENTVRAAFGEVEGYERIDVADLAEVKVIGSVVADITHLLAELLENAINFSEPTTSVVVNGRLESSGYVVTVVDQGIGMSQRELSDGNQRITDPPPLDQVPTRFLGLYVVGRLAERHGIAAKLTETTSGGIAAKVILPLDLIVTTEDEERRAESLKPVEVVEAVETSPLEEEHDLDAELASMTSDIDDSADDSSERSADDDSKHTADDDVSDDDDSNESKTADESSVSSGPTEVTDAGLPTRTRKGKSSAAVAELDAPKKTKSSESKKKVSESKKKVSGPSTSDSQDEVAKDEPKTSEAPTEEIAEPATNDLGLPVRNRGGALEQATVSIDRATVLDRAATDASPEAAGNFSSMMSALSSGVARGLEDTETDDLDDPKEENDK